MEFLDKVEGPIAVVGIAGKYRGGKSYVLNHLTGQPGGFGVGNTTNACTQGLWMWNQTVKVKGPDGKTINVLFVDTEGLDDVEKEQNNDVRIFMFAHWLCSHLIVNISQVLDQTQLSTLSLVTKMTEQIRLSKSS